MCVASNGGEITLTEQHVTSPQRSAQPHVETNPVDTLKCTSEATFLLPCLSVLQLSCFHSLFLLAENFTEPTDLGKGDQEVQHVCHLLPNPSLSVHTLTAVQSTFISLFSYQFCCRVRCKAVLMKIRLKHHPRNGSDLKLNF